MEFQITFLNRNEVETEEVEKMNEMAEAGYVLISAISWEGGAKLFWFKKGK